MKKIIMSALAIALWGISAQAQSKVGDNPTNTTSSAVFEMESTSKGMLLPRMTTAQRTAIASPVAGLQVYDTTTNTVWYYNGTVWTNTATTTTTASNGLSVASGDVKLGGTLSGPTTIDQSGQTLDLQGNSASTFGLSQSGLSAATNIYDTGRMVLQAEGADSSSNLNKLLIRTYATGNHRAGLYFSNFGGTKAAPANVPNGTQLGGVYFDARINGTPTYSSIILSDYKGNGTTNLSNIYFYTSGAQRLTIDENGGIGVGTSLANTSSLMDLTSTTKGFLMPRMTTAQRSAIATPATGLQVYDTDFNTIWFYNGTVWTNSGSDTTTASNGLTMASGDVKLGGALTGATTISGLTATNKIAFTGAGLDIFNVDTNTMSVDATNNRVGIGTNAPNSTLDVRGQVIATGQFTGVYSALNSPLLSKGSSSTGVAVGIQNLNGSTDEKLWDIASLPSTSELRIRAFNDAGTSSNSGLVMTRNTNTVSNAGFPGGNLAVGADRPASAVAALEVTSTTKGFLPPRMTTTQRNAISNPTVGLTIYNTTRNCLEWYNGASWYNACGNTDISPSSGGTGVVSGWSCSTASAGTLTAGTAVSGVTQTITATVTTIGTYNISISENGVVFAASGTFAGTGSQAIVLTATGTPLYGGTTTFTLSTTPGCSFTRSVTASATSGGSAVLSFTNCSTASAGTLYAQEAVSGVTQTITVNATTVGTYNITATANGVTFTGQGTLTAPTGSKTIVLTATGTPIDYGTSNFSLNTTPNCSFNRTIAIPANYAVCDGSNPTTVVDIVSLTGKTWMDRNLGASRVATDKYDNQAYGCRYQWGRGNDGSASMYYSNEFLAVHVAGTTNTLALSSTPGHAQYIGACCADWLATPNDNLWQGVSGVNNPCPSGYRIPTKTEFEAEFTAYNVLRPATGATSFWDMPHKFAAGGIYIGSLNTGVHGIYWTSTVSGTQAIRYLGNGSTGSAGGETASNRSWGASVRCIKD